MSQEYTLRVASMIGAPRARVYSAWTTPEILSRWFAPGTRTPLPEVLDVRPGGKFRIVMKGEDDAPIAVGEYREVVPGERLVFTWGWDGDPSQPTLVTVTFGDAGNATEVVLVHERFANAETCEHHRQGWQAIFDRMPAVFAAA